MDKLTMCRICLVQDVKMYSLISAKLQELYERLTEMSFVTKDNKPVQVCYLCCARLQNCHRLQVKCLKSEEFFTKVMADNELKQMELPDLNTLTTVHPLIVINCVPSTRMDTDDDNIDEENDIKFDPLEIASDFQVKEELFEDDSFIDETDIQPHCIDEDICAENGAMSDNSHIRRGTELDHDIHLKTVKIVLERIDLEQFERSRFAAKKPKLDLPNGDTESTVASTQSSLNVYKCAVCEKVFSTKSCLRRHSRIHTGEKPYSCEICKKSFTQYCNLFSHIRIHTGDRPYRCNICGKTFIRSACLINHTRIHTGERPYSCEICKKSFTQYGHLFSHIRTHTGDRPYRCNICGKTFNRRDILIQHTHIHTGERPYSCNICQKSFTEKRTLVRHTRVHSGEKPYSCKMCKRSFPYKKNLVNHLLNHSTVRPYACDICQKSFSTKSVLTRHIHIHMKSH